MPTERICLSMILLEPANTILYNSAEDQATDHLINGDNAIASPEAVTFRVIWVLEHIW